MTVEAVAYARCPVCGVLGPPGWITWSGDSDRPQVPVTIGCANCRTEYIVTAARELHLEQDAVVWHGRCRTAIPCPAVADLVLCSVREPGSPLAAGCGALIPGPAAGGQPPPVKEEPPPAIRKVPPPKQPEAKPWGW